jgi:hypothetical protein
MSRIRNTARDVYLFEVLKNQKILIFCKRKGADGFQTVACIFAENFIHKSSRPNNRTVKKNQLALANGN